MQAKSFHEAYRSLLSELMNHGVTEVNERTKTEIKMLQGTHSFKLDLSDGRLPVAGKIKMGHLSGGVNAGVSSASAGNAHGTVGNPTQGGFQFGLQGPLSRLPLPPGKTGAVVFHAQSDSHQKPSTIAGN